MNIISQEFTINSPEFHMIYCEFIVNFKKFVARLHKSVSSPYATALVRLSYALLFLLEFHYICKYKVQFSLKIHYCTHSWFFIWNMMNMTFFRLDFTWWISGIDTLPLMKIIVKQMGVNLLWWRRYFVIYYYLMRISLDGMLFTSLIWVICLKV